MKTRDRLIRAALAVADHPEHSVALAELKAAALAYRNDLERVPMEVLLEKLRTTPGAARAKATLERALRGEFKNMEFADVLADASWRDVMDVRGAGVSCLRTWARTLRALGLDPRWARDLDV